ncbi:hypothetical protein K7X08_018816 [Anisodus acutangulus]|uniref:Uncharacterized protein n=1 Tax=Anisodus acutangulus TaxID=402998 RepID=A0A9Q1LWE7_9SOLA|nr:hypothetical protein K7X08_018816 [Anisodus acutangulus]
MTSVTTMRSINDMICSFGYKNYKAEIKTADAQQSYKDGVIVLVTGCLTGKDNMRKQFTQTYVEENETANSSEMVNGVKDVAPMPLTPDPVVHGSLENEKLVGDEREIVVGAESHINENHASVNAQPATSVAQEDAPKKSYASIVSSQTKKGPTKIYVPASSRMAPAKAEKQPGHSIYVRNLPLNVTVAQLEVEFKKFGPIKQGGVQVRSNRQQGFCFGFVEFEDSSSMNRAIQASPVTIGGFQADVEIKRTTIRVGSGRGHFPPGKGGYRNDNFSGRRNFSGGRGYGRNDFVGMCEFSGRGGRGGEGYQQ